MRGNSIIAAGLSMAFASGAALADQATSFTATGTAGYYRLPGRYLDISVAFAP